MGSRGPKNLAGAILATAVLVAGVASSCGGYHQAPAPPKIRLTSDDFPDVLTPGIWPGAGLRAYREGDDVEVYTNWSVGQILETSVGEMTTVEAAQTICGQAINDLEIAAGLRWGTLFVTVFAKGGVELAFRGASGKCHAF